MGLKHKSKSVILDLLRNRTCYGFQLVKLLRESGPELLKHGEAVVYPLLRRLEDRRLVRGDWQLSSEGKRRRYYSLTQRGKRRLLELDKN